jgi:hypothetical protein
MHRIVVPAAPEIATVRASLVSSPVTVAFQALKSSASTVLLIDPTSVVNPALFLTVPRITWLLCRRVVGDERVRTFDLLRVREALFQLS